MKKSEIENIVKFRDVVLSKIPWGSVALSAEDIQCMDKAYRFISKLNKTLYDL